MNRVNITLVTIVSSLSVYYTRISQLVRFYQTPGTNWTG
jgi:hypothetical protein